MTDKNNLHAVLEFAQEKLCEGDYLKIAAALKDCVPKPAPLKINERSVGFLVCWETLKGHSFAYNVVGKRVMIYPGQIPNEYFFKLQALPDTTERVWSQYDFINKIKMLFQIFGVKNIKVSCGFHEVEYKNLKEYKQFLVKRDADSDDEEEHDYRDYCDEWVIGELFGLNM